MTGTDDMHSPAMDWFAEFEPLIRQALGSRIHGRGDIDDLAQEVYLRVLRIPQPELVTNPRAYLYRVAVNVAAEWRQRAAQALEHSSEPLDDLTAARNLEREAGDTERDRMVQEALAILPTAIRTAVILHTRDGLTYEQVAKHMGVTRRAVKRYIANGYAKLRERLQAVAPTPALGGAGNLRVSSRTAGERP